MCADMRVEFTTTINTHQSHHKKTYYTKAHPDGKWLKKREPFVEQCCDHSEQSLFSTLAAHSHVECVIGNTSTADLGGNYEEGRKRRGAINAGDSL